jgi:hypothetical protein
MEEVGKLLISNGIIRGEAELGEVSLDSFNWLSMWETESRRWAGRRVGAKSQL